ncbi:sialate:O-sulfotransferase 2-like [Saccoglossus kowalevskii]|uniref:WSC domain-containing protein 2-like n=1 Tax=Saccoglossus kowalevskii TaxID=10224 RepID=A0ABM0GZR8_SACKO|nr:PREDICTED: WSC domain-containing protein 2-like [Saccoglossus kowalevskii]
MTPVIMLSTHFHSEILEYDRGVGSIDGKAEYHGYEADRAVQTASNPNRTVAMKGVSRKNESTWLSKRPPDVGIDAKTAQEDKERSIQIISGLPVVYAGCYQDYRETSKRTLQGNMWHDNKGMTVDACVTHCSKKGLVYIGLQYSVECWCSSTLRPARVNENGCNMKCSGDPQQMCGGQLYLSVYHITKDQPENSKIINKKEDHKEPDGILEGFKGCIEVGDTDNVFLHGFSQTDSSMSVLGCKSTCVQKKFSIAALTGGNQCHCGHLENTFNYQNPANHSRCNIPCSGFQGHYCGGSNHASLYLTNFEDPRCQNASFKKDGSMPLVALASFPGSGNTWVRHLIERSSGIYTGSFYTDGELYKKGFKGEKENWKKRNTIVVKTHDFNPDLIKEYDAAIVVIRNPYKAMVAEHNRKFGGHTGYATEDKYKKGSEWQDFVMGKSRTWTNTAMMWLQNCPKVLVVHFEDLIQHMNRELRRMMEFLNVDINEERLLCAEMDSEGKFKRPTKKTKMLTFDPFTQEMREYVDIYIKTVAMALKLHNQPDLPKEYNPGLSSDVRWICTYMVY